MGTYIPIATVTVGSGGAANIEFTSIPATYTDLVLLTSLRSASNDSAAAVEFNGSSSSKSTRGLYGNGSAAFSYSGTGPLGGLSNGSTTTASTFANSILYIPNYAGSNNKSSSMDGVTENNATAANAFFNANLWSNTAAITSIKIVNETAANFVQHSSATLYGIKNS